VSRFSEEWKKNVTGKKVEVKRPLSKLGVTKLGMAAQLQRRDERASQLEDQRYGARVLARASKNKKKTPTERPKTQGKAR
jgi:hypothetical protein